MALAKYHEDILERLLEENRLLSDAYLFDAKVKPAKEHVTAHLQAATGLLNELLELLTSPEVIPVFANLDYAQLWRDHQNAQTTIEQLHGRLSMQEDLIHALNSECHQLQRKVDRLGHCEKQLAKIKKKVK